MDPFVAEIRIFAFNFPPKGWAHCDGQLMPISQNTALFALLGTFYGGDGKSTFALPGMQGCLPMHPNGGGNGLSLHFLGEEGGSETVTLLQSEMPVHSHTAQFSPQQSIERFPVGQIPAAGVGVGIYAPAGTPLAPLHQNALPAAGGSQPHNNMQPYLTMYFAIAMQGVFPPHG